MTLRLRVALAALAASLAVSATALTEPRPAVAAETPIQPGARMTAPSGCTLNFVFRDAVGRLSIGTAGHCVREVGDRVAAPAPVGQFGTVTFTVDRGNDDFALVRVDPDKLHLVNPQMRQFGGPTGVAVSDDTAVGDDVHVFGYGLLFGDTAITRGRTGTLTDDDSESYRVAIAINKGDSGGPVLHESGRAFGVVSHLPFGDAATLEGTSVERVLELLREAGMPQTLVTAPLLR